ncbi:MAG: hypothetical protein IPL94_10580 [Tetrasphaera sp.]|jgi:hypothetical protein|nr:hypothetical protein [Tetrasphaera sp.]
MTCFARSIVPTEAVTGQELWTLLGLALGGLVLAVIGLVVFVRLLVRLLTQAQEKSPDPKSWGLRHPRRPGD